MSTAPDMVGLSDRRNGDRRVSHLHLAVPGERRGESLNRDERVRVEELYVEAQAAADHAAEALAHAIASAQQLMNELRAARAASVAARRSAHLAAGEISGTNSASPVAAIGNGTLEAGSATGPTARETRGDRRASPTPAK